MVVENEIETQILNPLFDNKFDLNNFLNFLKEAFPNIELKNNPKIIPKEFKPFIDSAIDLGVYKADSVPVFDFLKVFVVKLTKHTSLISARTMQRNLIAKYLKNGPITSALVAFYDDFSDDWRLSFVKVKKRLVRTATNKLSIKFIASPPKRFSFLVGNEKNHTCKSRFLEFITTIRIPKLKDIENVFSVETVTNEFFEEYNRLYLALKDSLDKIREIDSNVEENLNKNHIESSDFAKKLMGQLVFIYFLQKKGWLGLKPGDKCGSGPKNFLRKLFNKDYVDYENFFNDVLEPLFYEGFSENIHDNHYSKFGFEVPFLNGGLFEPIQNYSWETTDILLKNEIFSEILDTFDKFNFTIKEDEPLEKEVAVDPEMLGKVFENLMEVIARKENGAFYTPRYIVHYICKETLISYLNENSNVSKNDLAQFINNGEVALESIIRNKQEILAKSPNPTKIKLPESIKENSNQLDTLLKNVRIIDPSVGSGAFPVGMMNEIVRLRHILFLLNDIDIGVKEIYDFKKDTIHHSLYGADIDYSATDITKLRFWLSLIVDEEVDNINEIQPLPNLDNHIICGDSLINEYEGIKLFDENLLKNRFKNGNNHSTSFINQYEVAFDKIEKLKTKFFDATTSEKSKLKKEINELKWDFIESFVKEQGYEDKLDEILRFKHEESKPFLLWELEFFEVFKGENPGFDIVIGNPPYGASVNKEEYIDGKLIKKNRSEIFFIKLSYDKLLKSDGFLGLIIPKSFTFVSAFIPIREYILENIETIIDCGQVWKDVRLEQVILIINKSQTLDYYCNGTRVDENLPIDEKINKESYNEFKVILDGVKYDEINLAKKIKKSNKFLTNISENQKGSSLQNKQSPNGTLNFIGGGDIHREGIIGFSGKVEEKDIKENDYIVDNSILVQEIISMSGNHIKIAACIPNIYDVVICNTINQIILDEKFNIYLFWMLLNSNLINWYCHKFIYANAIRTMHFNNSAIEKIPLPSFKDKILINSIITKSKLLYENYQKLEELKEELFVCLKDNAQGEVNISKYIRDFVNKDYNKFIKLKDMQNVNIDRIDNFEVFFNNIKNDCVIFIDNEIKPLINELNNLIYQLYELNEEEINLIENEF